MEVNINSVHFKTDKKLENFIEKKVSKLSGMFEGVIGSEVDNSDSRDNKIAEIRLLIKGYDLYAKKQSKTFEEATDTAISALKKQLEKYKERKRK